MSSKASARIIGAALLFLLAVSSVSAAEINYTSDDTFTVPAGVTQITVELWGAGGSGGAGDRQGGTVSTGGGGAGGQYAVSNITVSAGQEFNLTVAGTTAASAQTGADTTFWNGTGNIVVAKGGAGGTNAVTSTSGTGGLGSTSSGIGDTVYAGGDGADGVTDGTSGAGGGGAGSGGAGGSATGGTAGSGTANNPGGGGGAGVSGNNVNGNAGSLAGGAGSGGSRDGTVGGTGAAGYARITYSAPPDAPTGVSATDGSLTDRVTVTWTKSSGATGYYVYTSEDGLIASLGDVATYDHTSAPAGSITAGAASATDGTDRDDVTLSLTGESTNNGATRTYYVVAENSAGNSSDSATNTGYRGTGALSYQWQRSAADSDGSYSNIGGATTDPYTDTGAPQTGEGRYYRAVLDATGATQQISSTDRGYVNVTPFYSNFDGATTDFSAEGDLSSVSQPILEISSFGRIQWLSTLDVRDQDFDTYVTITDNSIDVDSANLDTGLNSRAEIRFYGLPYATEPVIFKDGDSCGPPQCNVTSYSAGTLIANVSGFSEYTTADYTATPNQTWTVTAWVDIDDTSGTQYLIEGINLGLKLVNSTSDRMLMHLNSGAHEWTAYTAPGLLTGQGWKHVAFVFRADDDYRRIYVNGVNETILGPNVDNTTLGLSSQFEIGSNASGVLDEVMIFDRALAESEIDAIYRAGLYPYRVNLSSLAQGNYTFVGYSVDEAGNYENTSTREITISTSLDCQTISSPGTYTLSADVSSSGTCFNITASDVTLDCAGYLINFSQSSSGSGIAIGDDLSNVSIDRCRIEQGSSTPDSHGIYAYDVDGIVWIRNISVTNVNVTTINASGMYLYRVNESSFANIRINRTATGEAGVYSRQHDANTWENVTIDAVSDINGFYMQEGSGNVVSGLTSSSENEEALQLYLSDDNAFFDLDLSSSQSARSLLLLTSDSNNFTGGTLTSTGSGSQTLQFASESTGNRLSHMSLSANSDYDIRITNYASGADNYLVNTTFNQTALFWSSAGSSRLHVAWYTDLYVNDTGGSPVSADINYTDSGTASTLNPTPSDTGLATDGTGYYRNLILYEWTENTTSRYSHTNYSFNVSNASYVPLVDESRNFSTNTQLTFTMFSDSGSPTWSNNWTNATAEYPKMNDSVRFNLTMNDDTALDDFVFSWNGTGSWVNDSSVDMASALEYTVSLTKDVDQPKGTLIAWRVYFNDSVGNTNVTDTFTFTVKNTAPPVPQLDYPADNESFLTNRTPRYNWTVGTDADGDPITFEWYLALDSGFTSMAGSNTSVLNEYYDQQSPLDFTTYWWRVAACDGEDCSANSTTFNFTVTSLVSIDLYNATPDFGNMSLGDTNDTTNDDPAPITVRNTGNIEANVSINASALWDSVGLDTDYYQVKIRQAEIGAYSLANLTYVNLSSTPTSMIESLGWEDAADEAYVDLRVVAPLDEYPGEKTSTIRVIAS